MKFLLSFVLLFTSIPAFATTINLANGSSATIHAGDETTVTCGGEGGHNGGGHDRCACAVGHGPEDSFLPACNSNWGFVLKIGGVPVKTDGCWASAVSAGQSCRDELKTHSECN